MEEAPVSQVVAANLAAVRARIATAAGAAGRPAEAVTLVAVSKTQPIESVRAALAAGQRVFGENRVQEALTKFPALRDEFPDLALHLIGPLQTNKVKDAVAHCDVIETVDRPRLAEALAREFARQGRTLPCFIEVNTGEEQQKAGVLPAAADAFIARLPRAARTADRRADVRAARARGAGPAFRAAARDRPAQRARHTEHGDERRFRDRDPLRRDPRPRRHRHLRRPANNRRSCGCELNRSRYRPLTIARTTANTGTLTNAAGKT